MVFLVGTTEEEIKSEYLEKSEDEIEKFDGWIRRNGGTIEYGMAVTENTPVRLEDLEGPVEDDWAIGLDRPPRGNNDSDESDSDSESDEDEFSELMNFVTLDEDYVEM